MPGLSAESSDSQKWRRYWLNRFMPWLATFLLIALAGSTLLERWARSQKQTQLIASQQSWLNLARRELGQALAEAATNLESLAGPDEMTAVFEAPLGSASLAQERYLHFMERRRVFDRMQILDDRGNERFRINMNHGLPTLVPAAQLRNLSTDDEFIYANRLSFGQIYLSPPVIQTERGQIVEPQKPVLRLAMSLFGAHRERRGVVVLNLLAEPLFERLRSTGNGTAEFWMLDRHGNWLMGGLPENRFNQMRHQGISVDKAHPHAWKALQATESGVFSGDGELWVYEHIMPLTLPASLGVGNAYTRLPLISSDDPYRWTLVARYDRSQLAAEMTSITTMRWISLALASLLGIGLAALIATLQLREARRSKTLRPGLPTFAAMLDALPQPALLLDQEGRCLHANPGWQRWMGPGAEAAGDGWLHMIQLEDRTGFDARRQTDTPQAWSVAECRLVNTLGATLWARCEATPLGLDLHMPLQWLSWHDLTTSTRQLQTVTAAKEMLEGVVNGSADMIAALDLGFGFSLFNRAFRDEFHGLYGIELAIGDNLLECLRHRPRDRGELLMLWGRALQGEVFSVRQSLGDDAGRKRYDISFSPCRAHSGELIGAVQIVRDVTEIARMQSSIARSEELLRATFTGSLDAIFVFEVAKDEAWQIVDFILVEANPNALRLIGAERESAINQPLSALFPPSLARQLIAQYREVVESGTFISEELELNTPELPIGWLQQQVIPLSNGVAVTARDTSARKIAEHRLTERDAMQRAILNSAAYAIISTDKEGTIVFFNKAAENMLGHSADRLVGKATPALFHVPEELVRHAVKVSEALGRPVEPGLESMMFQTQANGMEMGEWTYIHKDGHRFPVLLSITPVRDEQGNVTGYVGIAIDISRQKAFEAERDRLIAVIEHLPDVVGIADLKGNQLYMNPAGLRLLGFSSIEELTSHHITDHHPDWTNRLIMQTGIPTAQAQGSWTGETQWLDKTGKVHDTLQTIIAPLQNGKPVGFTATIAHDLSEIKTIESRLMRNEVRLNAILEGVQDAVVTVSCAGEIDSVNPAVVDVFGYGPHELIGHRLEQIVPESLPELLERRAALASQQPRHNHSLHLETTGRHKDGGTIELEVLIGDSAAEATPVYILVLRDVTANKRHERQLQETIGELRTAQQLVIDTNAKLQQANAELKRMVNQDGLTKVANRRFFDQTLLAEWQRSARNGSFLTLLMIDVDYFKRYNDSYGHQAGDECLKRVAGVLVNAASRPSDFVARYGGEEFAMILPETDLGGAAIVTHRIRDLLQHEAIPHAFSATGSFITLSIGQATVIPLSGVNPEYLVSAADQALYTAKAKGRNQVVLAGAG